MLYCAGFQSVALREALQHFRCDTRTLARLRDWPSGDALLGARVPADWRVSIGDRMPISKEEPLASSSSRMGLQLPTLPPDRLL